MKINLFTKVIFVLAVSVLFCCKNLPDNLLAKKWIAVDATQKDGSGKMVHPDDKKMITEQEIIFEFKVDGTYFFSAHGDESETGKYNISADGKNVQITPAGTQPSKTFIINELTQDKLIIGLSPNSALIMEPHN